MSAASPTGHTTLAILGGGPNCTYAVERLAVTLRRRTSRRPIRIDIFEKTGFFGAGNVHRPDQPASSLLNRIIGQVAFAPDESYPAAGSDLLPASLRPTMVEWAQARYRESGDETYNLKPEDWPPRRLLGESLIEHFNRYLALLREVPGVEVHLHSDEVTSVDRHAKGYVLGVGARGGALTTEHLLLLTGNSVNRPRANSTEARLASRAEAPGFDFVPYPYPLRNIPDSVTGPDQIVGCIGLGQTANDVILFLTEERGGRFVAAADGDGLEYLPCGREPKSIIAISHSGVFTAARPYNQKLADPSVGDHEAVFFKNSAIDTLRAVRGVPVDVEGFGRQRQLDFERDVFPIMLLEMECLYYKTLFGDAFGGRIVTLARPRLDAFLQAPADHWTRDTASDYLLAPLREEVSRAIQEIEGFLANGNRAQADADTAALIAHYFEVILGTPFTGASTSHSRFGHPLDPNRHRFSWQRLIAPIASDDYTNPDQYREAILAYMKYDHLQSAQGNISNPTKAVTDGIWRDLRETISYAIDFAGVTPESHSLFLQKYLRYHNRLADGACIELMEKMRALVRSGILNVSTGPDPEIAIDGGDGRVHIRGPHTGADVVVDTIVDGKLSNINLTQDASPLYQSLLANGLVKVWENPGHDGENSFCPGGPALTRTSNPIGVDGVVDERITILGPPSEGVMFFQGTLARPFCNHQVLNEVIGWAKRFEAHLDATQHVDATGEQRL